MQFVKTLEGEQQLSHGIDHYLRERCGRKLEQVIPWRDGNKVKFILIFNDPEVITLHSICCISGCGDLIGYQDNDYHFVDGRFYHRFCCPAPWHHDDSEYINANKQVALCSVCKSPIYGKNKSCCHPSFDPTHMNRETYFHSRCCMNPSLH